MAFFEFMAYIGLVEVSSPAINWGLGQLFDIKPGGFRGSLLRDELAVRLFETQSDLI